MLRNYDEDHINGSIAKPKKLCDGIDVESYMSGLRDDLIDKEVAEKLSKEVSSYIIEQLKRNMDNSTEEIEKRYKLCKDCPEYYK